MTDLLHVASVDHGPEELWVEVHGPHHAEAATWVAPWNPKVDVVDRYRASIASLVRRTDGGGLVGGLGVSGSDVGALRAGPVTVCETRSFGQCAASSSAWADKAGELAACFPGEDESSIEVLVQGDQAAARCEVAGLEVPSGREGQREACLCRALGASAAFHAKAGRRTVRVRFEATDLAGKARPELRVVEASTDLHSEADWHSIRTTADGKSSYRSVQRLIVDNLDALAAPLARCAVPAGSVVISDIDVHEDGAVERARVVTGLASKGASTCIEKALGRGAFSCPEDGKTARVRVAITWPEQTK